jgi:hypothetical protein
MADVTASVFGRRAADPKPVLWRRLAWVTWRQQRSALLVAAAVFGGLSVWMLINGLLARSAMGALGLDRCHPVTAGTCAALLQSFQAEGYPGTANAFAGALLAAPALVGVFLGGPLLARELESGTSRFAWTQGCGRLRWTLAKLVPLAILVTAGAAGVTLVTTWYTQIFVSEGLSSGVMRPTLFDVRGVDFAAWTLVAFTIAAFAGVAIKRTVPAMVAAIGAWAALFLITTLRLRQHYEAPLLASTIRSPGAWVVGGRVTGPEGHILSQVEWSSVVAQAEAQVGQVRPGQEQQFFAWLAQHGYTHWWLYQPASRFWPFQLVEGGWLLALSLVLLSATVWLARRRAA